MAIGFVTLDSVNRRPDKGMRKSSKPKVLLAQYGDGYELRVRDGINNVNEIYTVNFSRRPKAEIDKIIDFLDSKAGTDNFTFTVPDSAAGGGELAIKVVCDTYSHVFDYDEYWSATATFRRVFEP